MTLRMKLSATPERPVQRRTALPWRTGVGPFGVAGLARLAIGGVQSKHTVDDLLGQPGGVVKNDASIDK